MSGDRHRGARAKLAVWLVAAGAAAVLLPASPAPARAAGDPGVRLGYYAGADADDPVPTIGVFGRIDVPGPVNLELSADYRRESLLGGDLEATVVPVRLSAVLSLAPVVGPYVSAGVGADFVALDFGGGLAHLADDSSVALAAHAGGGVEVGVGPLSIIGDLRYHAVEPISSDATRSALGHAYDPSGWQLSLSVGVSF